MAEERAYICIDLKSYYASVECAARNLNPLTTNLLVADESRSDKTICLAVSPSLKAIGVPGRPRLFEAKQKIRRYEWEHNQKVDYIVAVPRMAAYEKISADIYAIYRQYVSSDDIHVYSIDECFIDLTPYLHLYEEKAARKCMTVPQYMAAEMVHEVYRKTRITATVGIGTNMYLAKVAMDIVAKKAKPDKLGMRMAELDEKSYCYLLWSHQPLTDFWMIGPGKAKRLSDKGLYTMGDIAAYGLENENYFYKTFGIDAEIMLDHAWGIEPVTMANIKNYHSSSNSLSNGQVLKRPYFFHEARTVFSEMIEGLCADMFAKNKKARGFAYWVSYDSTSLDDIPDYDGPIVRDYYGRLYPGHTAGNISFRNPTNQLSLIRTRLLEKFDTEVNRRFTVRRLNVSACDVIDGSGIIQIDLFHDPKDDMAEEQIRRAVTDIRKKYGKNAILNGSNLLEGATARERNEQIGGHKA